jgi:hypothetical protein
MREMTDERATQLVVVHDNHHAVPRKPDVELQPVGAEVNGLLECLEAVLRRHARRAPVGDDSPWH